MLLSLFSKWHSPYDYNRNLVSHGMLCNCSVAIVTWLHFKLPHLLLWFICMENDTISRANSQSITPNFWLKLYWLITLLHYSPTISYNIESGKWAIISDPSIHSLSQPGLRLKPGALYSVRVGAANKAGAVAAYDTNGVLLDNTPPKVRILI